MEKNNPPPYSEIDTAYPQPGFHPLQPQPQPQPLSQPQPAIPVNSIPIVITVLGPQSQQIICPYCHHQIATRVETEAGSKTHLYAALLCLLGGIICCIIPYCTDSCQDRNHYCPSCESFLGAYNDG